MKKIRGLRRRYRKINKRISEFKLHLGNEEWYNGYHVHLDWKGLTNYSVRNRRSHIIKYLDFLDKIEDLSKESNRAFQAWILLDPEFGSGDAIYFHTENPDGLFPLRFDHIEWDAEPNELLKDLIDLRKYDLGRCNYNDSMYSFCIQKKGLGISLRGFEEGVGIT
jgi:hypothetical protein